ncbi:MAG: hypothetical protein JSR27_06255 [Proteobacteria bacterium]|nr:hypothetical protein [Pseudomonadota bacterium]
MNPKEHLPYRGGQLHQICSKCNWWQAGHGVVVQQCPQCGEATSNRIALEFGGFIVEFDGTQFTFHDSEGRQVILDEADYPEAIAFMVRHAEVKLEPSREAASRPSPWPIRSGAGDYRDHNHRMRNTYLFQYWAKP